MCTTNVYTYVYPDGHKETSEQATLCASSRHNKPCNNNVVFKHPKIVQYTDGASGASPSSSYLAQFPPSPSYTPRSSTPNHRSGDESDRSRRSSSSSRRRASIYINGQRVVGLDRHDGPSSRRERIVLVDGPPTPRTPPQAFNFPHTAPASPNTNASPYLGSSPRESISGFSRRPIIVDDRQHAERPRVRVEVLETSPSSRTSRRDRHSSASSRESRSYSGDEEESRRRQRERDERRAEKEREEDEERQRKVRARIAKANAEINKRPAVPVPPAPVRASSFSSTAAAVGPADLVDGVKGMTFEEERREEKARKIARKQQREDEEAQRQRLAERMMPRRRATVGPGSRRHRVLYDDGVYRWE
ncbi:hypothetical protein PT974_07959 [Cladobotryum mycophilum]|uniref:Uncharacterized protein n=1 Tax=Cladobotryum mycophilum TaxID=491253 RepID=A0ABR0SC09_9HYPO